jgi:hypothetical protein
LIQIQRGICTERNLGEIVGRAASCGSRSVARADRCFIVVDRGAVPPGIATGIATRTEQAGSTAITLPCAT